MSIMKNQKKQKMIAICGYLIITIALFGKTIANHGESNICKLQFSENESKIGFQENKLIELSDLIYLLENINNQPIVNRKTSELGYTTRATGIYITTALDRNRRPISIITIISIGSYKTVSLKISELAQFTHLVDYITENYKTEKANRSVFDELEMRFLGDKYICDIFVPLNGVNTTNNDYYEIIVSKR